MGSKKSSDYTRFCRRMRLPEKRKRVLNLAETLPWLLPNIVLAL
ncbi:hypothetical protein EIKCOROL_02280 [Eikenella corrodens ATCC 23834]|uniref:Uncharacterized protein n=1 Tax=Eikenella corrodens ATCC 23834 TaxID=546274 RepID=C0DY18_EIKCO|nr:hypothetical protein EIKCOROL_02280 [Eikenella corrodens ATCC 23834]